MININTITTNMLQEQTYILHDETKECVIIDPGFASEREISSIYDFIENMKLKPVAVWFTHLHFDHIMGAQYIIEKYATPTFACEKDLPLLKANRALTMSWGIDYPQYDLKIDNFINDGDSLHFGNSSMIAIHAPGHSQGSMVYYSEDGAFCISGDVIFRCSVGRTDFLGGDSNTLLNSIRQKILTLPPDTTIFPGHGPATTVDDEINYNPFLRPQC